jgi:hypothetical protein
MNDDRPPTHLLRGAGLHEPYRGSYPGTVVATDSIDCEMKIIGEVSSSAPAVDGAETAADSTTRGSKEFGETNRAAIFQRSRHVDCEDTPFAAKSFASTILRLSARSTCFSSDFVEAEQRRSDSRDVSESSTEQDFSESSIDPISIKSHRTSAILVTADRPQMRYSFPGAVRIQLSQSQSNSWMEQRSHRD